MPRARLYLLGLSATLLLCALPNATRAETPVLAVFPIQDSAGKLTPDTLSQLTDYFGAQLAASGRYTVVPKKDLEAALREKKADSFKQCVDQACQIEIGKEVAAQKVCQSQIVKLGDRCGITSTIFDLRTATSEKAAVAKGGCTENELVESLEKVAADLIGNGPAAPPPLVASTPPPPAPGTPPPGVPTFMLRVSAEPVGAEVKVDGRMIGKGEVSTAIEAHVPHKLVVSMEDHGSYEEQVTLEEDGKRLVQLELTNEARALRSESFGFSLAVEHTLGGSNGVGIWLAAPTLRFGSFVWTLIDGLFGIGVGTRLRRTVDETGDLDPDTGLRLQTSPMLISAFSSRVGFRFSLDDAGKNQLELTVGPAFDMHLGFDDHQTAQHIGLALAPTVRYLRVPDGSFGVGFGLRAIIPLLRSCSLASETDETVIDFASCKLGNPLALQLEIPFGVY